MSTPSDLHFGCRRQHRSAEGRRELGEACEFQLEQVSDARLILWSGCDADREPIVEVRQITYFYPGPDDPGDGEETKTIGWFHPSQLRDLFSLAGDATSRAGDER